MMKKFYYLHLNDGYDAVQNIMGIRIRFIGLSISFSKFLCFLLCFGVINFVMEITGGLYLVMKNFRSSKNLKPIDPQLKQQCQLRIKIKSLQQQIALLQKSNLNILIPLSEHPQVQPQPDYQSIIRKLNQQILALEQQNINIKNANKKLEKQKIQIKNKYENDIQGLKNVIEELKEQVRELKEEVEQVCQKLEVKCQQYDKLEKDYIEKTVQLKFVRQDLCQQQKKCQNLSSQLASLHKKISLVTYGSRIHKSEQTECICLQKTEYESLKNRIKQLQAQIRALIEANKREKISLGCRKSDIGEEIVRLKKNIDLQLGIQGESQHTEEFLKMYRGANFMLDQMIKRCQA